MAKKRPKVSSLGGISRAEAENIGKRVTVPTPVVKKVVKKKGQPVTAVKKKAKLVPPPLQEVEDPMVIVRIRKSFKKRAKSKASALDLNLYQYLEQLIDNDQ